jgi:hypothetical protein
MDDSRDASVGTRTRVPGSGLPGGAEPGGAEPGGAEPGAGGVPDADVPDAGVPDAGVSGADVSGAGGVPGAGAYADADLHPVLGCVAALNGALSAVAGVDPMFMSTTDKRQALLEIHRVRTRLEALQLKVTACAGDVAAADGDPNVAAWLGPRTLDDPRTNHRAEKLARRLATRWTLTQTALGAALLNTAQAHVIVEALEVLHAADLGVPAEVKAGLLGQAEQTLLGYAAEFGPKQLRVLGRRILQVLAPELFDEAERKRLEEEERRAHARTRLTLHRNGDGTTTLRATLPDAVALRLKNLLEAYTSPRHPGTRPHGGNSTGDQGSAGHCCAGEHGTGEHGTGEHGTGDNGSDQGSTADNATAEDNSAENGTSEHGTGEDSTGEHGTGDNGGPANSTADNGSDQDSSADDVSGRDDSADDVSGQHGTGDQGRAGHCCAGEHGSGSGAGAGSGGLGAGVPLVDPATGEKVPHDQRMGLALQAFLEALDPARLPVKAGAGTSLLVTIDYEHLRRGVGVATLPNGEPISVGETRRLACACGILPAVLGADSQVLDLGRMRRLFEWAQRIAKRITTFTCQAYGCTVPADWCEAHHGRTPWAEGGTTDLADLDFLCPFHHHRAHDPGYRVERMPNGDYRFHRRT